MTSTDQPTTTSLVYAIEHPRPGFPGETWRMGYGTASNRTVDEVAELAVDVARRARVEHSHYTGRFTVYVWVRRPDEHYRQPIPDNAANHHFGEGWTGADGCGCKDA